MREDTVPDVGQSGRKESEKQMKVGCTAWSNLEEQDMQTIQCDPIRGGHTKGRITCAMTDDVAYEGGMCVSITVAEVSDHERKEGEIEEEEEEFELLEFEVGAEGKGEERKGGESKRTRARITIEELTVNHVADWLAEKRGQSLPQMALAWSLRDPRMTSLVIGASSVAQLEQNVDALDSLDFTAEELAEIDRLVDFESGVDEWADARAGKVGSGL